MGYLGQQKNFSFWLVITWAYRIGVGRGNAFFLVGEFFYLIFFGGGGRAGWCQVMEIEFATQPGWQWQWRSNPCCMCRRPLPKVTAQEAACQCLSSVNHGDPANAAFHDSGMFCYTAVRFRNILTCTAITGTVPQRNFPASTTRTSSSDIPRPVSKQCKRHIFSTRLRT